jgi:hypothetical protein
MKPIRRTLAALVLVATTTTVSGAAPAKASERDGQHDFDFLIGKWKVHNRRLKEPLAGSKEWYEFDAVNTARKVWGGKANMDEFEGDTPTGQHLQGMTVRLYEPKSHQWRLYWANSTRAIIDVPTVGEFKNGRGEFFDEELYNGRSIFVRYVWSDITANSCHWEQAFSTDGGKTWETNWIMNSTRLE